MHITLLILSKIWSKGSNLTSFLIVDVFSEVAEVNTEDLTTSFGKNIAEEVPRQNVFLYSYFSILFAVAENAEIRRLPVRHYIVRDLGTCALCLLTN